MTFELLCATMIALLFGTMVCFGGYHLFLTLLPIWGFFFGFGLGAQTIQALFGDTFLSTVTSWVAGFIVATAVGGAGVTIGTLTLGIGGVQLLRLINTPLKTMFDASSLWTILFLIMSGMGIVAQIRVNRAIEIEAYNRWATS